MSDIREFSSSIDKQRINSIFTQFFYDEAPNYRRAIRVAKDARHFWFALQDWRDEHPEE